MRNLRLYHNLQTGSKCFANIQDQKVLALQAHRRQNFHLVGDFNDRHKGEALRENLPDAAPDDG